MLISAGVQWYFEEIIVSNWEIKGKDFAVHIRKEIFEFNMH